MWDEPQSQVEAELQQGEQLLWSGQPKQGVRLRGHDAFLIPFSLLWCGFVVFWETMVLTIEDAPLFAVLWGIPFVVAGLYFVFGRFLIDAKMRRRTYYGVTDERGIIVSGLFSRKVKSVSLRALSDISLTVKGDGSGTITFGPVHPMAAWFAGVWWPGMGQYQAPTFDMIEDVREVHDLIVRAQKSATTQAPSG
jgi:hypothetical protein